MTPICDHPCAELLPRASAYSRTQEEYSRALLVVLATRIRAFLQAGIPTERRPFPDYSQGARV